MSKGSIVLGICGLKGAGKDTIASCLNEELWTNLKFAGALKEMMRSLLKYRGADDETIERMIEGDLKEVPSEYLEGKTCRYAMQTLGTEWGRNTIGDSLWVNSFKDKAKQYKYVYCTDLRFPNELKALKDMNAKTVRIERQTCSNKDPHESEKYVLTMDVDYVINNDSSIEAAQNELTTILYSV